MPIAPNPQQGVPCVVVIRAHTDLSLQASQYIKEAMEQMEDEEDDDDPDGMAG